MTSNWLTSRYLFFRQLWLEDITAKDQALKIIKRAAYYAFFYWWISCSLLSNQLRHMRPQLKSLDTSQLSNAEQLFFSPLFPVWGGLVMICALICSVVMGRRKSSMAAALLLGCWAIQLYFRVMLIQPSFIWTPLFCFVVWTTYRAFLATKTIHKK